MYLTPLARDGLILFDTVRDFVGGSRMFRREVSRGNLVALRRGAFVETEVWATLSDRSRYLLLIRAVGAAHRGDMLLAGMSAAAVWGMPVAGPWPTEVTMLEKWSGGGRSENGVRKTAVGFTTALPQCVGEFRVTSLARTALDVARSHSFSDALGSVDWALSHKNPARIQRDDLLDELARMKPRTGGAHLKRIVSASTELSDSFGESQCRAMIGLLGFEEPELQVVFTDSQGGIRPDYFWRSIRQAAEFDGKSQVHEIGIHARRSGRGRVAREKERRQIASDGVGSHAHPHRGCRPAGTAGVAAARGRCTAAEITTRGGGCATVRGVFAPAAGRRASRHGGVCPAARGYLPPRGNRRGASGALATRSPVGLKRE